MMLRILLILTLSTATIFCWPPLLSLSPEDILAPYSVATHTAKLSTDTLGNICEASVEVGSLLQKYVLPQLIAAISEATEADQQGTFPRLSPVLKKALDTLKMARMAVVMMTTAAEQLGCTDMKGLSKVVDFAANMILPMFEG